MNVHNGGMDGLVYPWAVFVEPFRNETTLKYPSGTRAVLCLRNIFFIQHLFIVCNQSLCTHDGMYIVQL